MMSGWIAEKPGFEHSFFSTTVSWAEDSIFSLDNCFIGFSTDESRFPNLDSIEFIRAIGVATCRAAIALNRINFGKTRYTETHASPVFSVTFPLAVEIVLIVYE